MRKSSLAIALGSRYLPQVAGYLTALLLIWCYYTPSFAQSPAAESQNKTLTAEKGDRPAVIESKPEPKKSVDSFRLHVKGKIILRCIFSSNGKVTDVRFVKAIPADFAEPAVIKDLTKRATEAAKGIKFIPAVKDGRSVSQYIGLEYTFDLEDDGDDDAPQLPDRQ